MSSVSSLATLQWLKPNAEIITILANGILYIPHQLADVMMATRVTCRQMLKLLLPPTPATLSMDPGAYAIYHR